MTTTRNHSHSFPAPSSYVGASSVQSKSHVLAGVQDAYWSDDEAEDADCPLCLEEMDISDINFKPCVCGYQICRFCWHHIKENLNGRCPACRREYSDDTVQFKPINQEDHKRLTQQKKQRERERKELETLNRRHLANVRVVQRNVVYVVGIGPRFAKEELIPTLRSNEYFGQYGKISKIVLVKRTAPGGRVPVVGLYITYHRREDAARAIAAVDGAPSPGGGNDVMRASHGTAKYCMTFLRGNTCNDHSCMNLHDWGDEKDCFTKEDLTTLKHTMKDLESRPRSKRTDDAEAGLPRAASWGQKGTHVSTTALHNNILAANQSTTTTTRSTRRGGGTRQPRSGTPTSSTAATETRISSRRAGAASSLKASSQASSSRPPTPAGVARPSTPASSKVTRLKEQPPPRSPTSSVAVESDLGSGSQEVASGSPAVRPQSADSIPSSGPSAPPVVPAVPPGLSAPPGLPPPKRVATESPQIGLAASQSSYQMSTQVQALLDDVKARREAAVPSVGLHPFPDFDRMLQTLRGGHGGGFSFNLDPKLAGDASENLETIPGFETEASIPFQGNYMDAFPGLRPQNTQASAQYTPPPGISPTSNHPLYDSFRAPPLQSQPSSASNYTGSFNPFADVSEDASQSSAQRAPYSPLDEERKVSRFGFARGRRSSTTASSPLHAPSPMSNSDNFSHAPFYNSPRLASPVSHAQSQQWHFQSRQPPEYGQPSSAMGSPLVQHAQAAYPGHFHPFDEGVSEAQLREFILQSSRDRTSSMRNAPYDPQLAHSFQYNPGQAHAQAQAFNDPAIMSSARFISPLMPSATTDGGYAAPPSMESLSSHLHASLQFTEGATSSPVPSSIVGPESGSGLSTSLDMSQAGSSAQVSRPVSPTPPTPILSSSDFPALGAESQVHREGQPPLDRDDSPNDAVAQAKAEKRAAKKAAATEKALERQRIAQEKAVVKMAERARVASEKAAEREKAAALKAEKERVEKERLEKEKMEKEKAEKERAEKEKLQALAKDKSEKEKAAQVQQDSDLSLDLASTKKQSGPKQDAGDTARVVSPAAGKTNTSGKGSNRQSPKDVSTPVVRPVSVTQVPILSKMPKKNKPSAKPIKIPREEDIIFEEASAIPSSTPSDTPQLPLSRATRAADLSSNNSRAQSIDRAPLREPSSLADLFTEIDLRFPWMNLADHPLFDLHRINPAAKMPLEYGPLVHALSALSVGGGSFANNMPSGSIDNAVSSFQQLLETLTQTISDLLRLLPRTTWDDSSSFDGVLRDMLKGDDFLEDGTEEGAGKDDEVAALTLALERRARWMEVQLSKLEELHRDINTAAVRAVLAFNDNGWDQHNWMPRVGNTLMRFDKLGMVEDNGVMRIMTADELEKKLAVAREAAVFAETEMRESVERMSTYRPFEDDEM